MGWRSIRAGVFVRFGQLEAGTEHEVEAPNSFAYWCCLAVWLPEAHCLVWKMVGGTRDSHPPHLYITTAIRRAN